MQTKILFLITLLSINLSFAQEEDKSIGIEDALHGEYVQSFKVKKNGAQKQHIERTLCCTNN